MQYVLKGREILYHSLFWLLAYVFWIYVFRNNALVLTRTITIQFCYLIFIAANFYFNTLYNISSHLDKKRYVKFGIFFLLAITATAIIRVPVSYLVTSWLFRVSVTDFNYLDVFYNSFINILFWVVLILGGKMISDKIRSGAYIAKIEREKDANELNFLRAQFNPHFLFNSINSIYGHIDKTNKPAREMLLKFSEMLRYQLYECNVEEIEMDRELNYIKNYVSLQKSRMDERIRVVSCFDSVNGNKKIAPLLLIAFIENAFKYVGFNEGKDNFVQLSINQKPGNLHFNIVNSKDGYLHKSENSSGLGIGNARRRLELLYPGRHALQIDDQPEYFDVDLILYDA
jgi:two-component system, LytTR family, sensor kinase